MSVQRTSLKIVGIIWLLVGIGLSLAGLTWIFGLGFGPKLLFFIVIAVAIGLLKWKFVMRKVATKYQDRANLIEFTENDTTLGWAKILGIKGFVLIGVMIAAGALLRHSNIDRPILGIVYLAVGISLVYASKIFFERH